MADPRPNSPEDVGFIQRPAPVPSTTVAPAAPHGPKTCRSCGAPILWAQVLDEKGNIRLNGKGRPKAIPVDFAPGEKGNVQLFDRGGSIVARVLGAPTAQKVRDAAWALGGKHALRTPHFMTCPNADQWRRE